MPQFLVGTDSTGRHCTEAAASSINIQPPATFRSLHRFQFIGKITVFQEIAAIPPERKPPLCSPAVRKELAGLSFVLSINIKPNNKGDSGNFSDGSTSIESAHLGPCPLSRSRGQAFQSKLWTSFPLPTLTPQPNFNLPARSSNPQGLAAYPAHAMLKHRFWALLLEVHQREQLGAKPRTEDQFMLFPH